MNQKITLSFASTGGMMSDPKSPSTLSTSSSPGSSSSQFSRRFSNEEQSSKRPLFVRTPSKRTFDPRASLNYSPTKEPSDISPHRLTALVLSPSFFNDASKECNNIVEAPVLRDAHLRHPKDGSTQAARSWRQRLVSPLGTLLTGVRTNYPWVQLAGHKGGFLPGQGGTICKQSSDHERAALEALMEDVLRPMVPLYYREDVQEGERYLEMEDLLYGFEDPSVMDVKMGVRTFLESEVTKKERRMDLLKKMIELAPNEPSEEEKEQGITKLRYMSFREELSSTKEQGFRLEGIKLSTKEPKNDFQRVKAREEIVSYIGSFLPGLHDPVLRSIVLEGYLSRLKSLRDHLLMSKFFMEHELIGSSLLFIYDSTGKCGVWMIDFGKTIKVDKPLSHRDPWVLGNREDGYLFGLDNLITVFHDLLKNLNQQHTEVYV